MFPTIEQQAEHWKLNDEQKSCFLYFAIIFFKHFLKRTSSNGRNNEKFFFSKFKKILPQNGVRCFFTAEAGCGKSRVIKCFVQFVTRWEGDDCLLVTATSGIAAVLLSADKLATTYHSALNLNFSKKKIKK